MALKKDKAKKRKPKPKGKKRISGLVILDGKRQIDRRTGLNRDIPMGGGGGSPNLLAALAARPPITGQAQVIQTPDQFKQAQDISNIASELAAQKKQRLKIGELTDTPEMEDLKGSMMKPSGQEKMMMTEKEKSLRQEALQELRDAALASRIPMQPASQYVPARSAGGAAQIPTPVLVQMPKPQPKPKGRPPKAKGQQAMTQPPAEMEPPQWYGGETAPLAQPSPDPFASSLVGKDEI